MLSRLGLNCWRWSISNDTVTNIPVLYRKNNLRCDAPFEDHYSDTKRSCLSNTISIDVARSESAVMSYRDNALLPAVICPIRFPIVPCCIDSKPLQPTSQRAFSLDVSSYSTRKLLLRVPTDLDFLDVFQLEPTHNQKFVKETSETVGKVKWDEYPLKKGESLSESVEVKPPPDPLWKRTVKLLKILLPHVGLNLLLLTYIAMGALVFIWLEADNELQNRRAKLQNILKMYSMIMNETYSICAHEFNVSSPQNVIERRMRPLLSLLSRAHEYDDRFTLTGQLWTDSEEHMVTRWSFAAAVLYALTVITSTGYDHVTPSTDPGRIFTVFFGLVGIPLMFITAADIGKFLSEVVIRSYGKLLQLFTWIGSVVDAIRDYVNDEDDSIDSRKGRGSRRVSILDEEDDDEDRLQLPIASYFALIIGYCAIGSLLFNAFEKGPIWSFMHGLFFSFNTITTIGLGNIYVRDQFYLALIVAYVIIGLAVITASLDLCSSTLKRTFTKLHYFGRKIRGARRGFANMSDDIREAMRIIAALKKTRPSKERITLEDLKRFLEVQEHLIRQPYVPYNVHIFRWIEDAYAQYFDETGTMGEKEKMRNKEPILFF